MPQLFTKTDDFGAYTDIKVTATHDTSDAWLGLIPVQCMEPIAKRTSRPASASSICRRSGAMPNISECWMTQGQAIQTKKPTSTGPGYKIYRPKEFIDWETAPSADVPRTAGFSRERSATVRRPAAGQEGELVGDRRP